MKLTFMDLKKQSFTIEAEPAETIADVKKKLAEQQGPEFASCRLIYSGKILTDPSTVESYKIKESDHIICMITKPKASTATSSTGPSTPAPPPTKTPGAPAPATTSSTGNAPATPTPASTSTTQQPPSERRFDDTSPLLLGPERQAAIANMESMGFERPQVERAMRAAFFNPDRAVEFLLNGIPEGAGQEAPARPSSGIARSPQNPATGTAAPASTTPATQATDAAEPVNLFDAAAAAGQGGRGTTRSTAATEGEGAATGARGSSDAAIAAAAAAGGNLDFLRENPMFQQLRQMVQQQPQMLEGVLQQLAQMSPQLAQMIASNPEQFLQLLGEGTDGEGVPLPPGAQDISVTEEEREAIERLCGLGFERDLVIQAYFACDKNEDLAANFLFDHSEEPEEGG